jgi:hypothetical protein
MLIVFNPVNPYNPLNLVQNFERINIYNLLIYKIIITILCEKTAKFSSLYYRRSEK